MLRNAQYDNGAGLSCSALARQERSSAYQPNRSMVKALARNAVNGSCAGLERLRIRVAGGPLVQLTSTSMADGVYCPCAAEAACGLATRPSNFGMTYCNLTSLLIGVHAVLVGIESLICSCSTSELGTPINSA